MKQARVLTAVSVVIAATGALSSTATAATKTETFDYTGAAQTWTVPPGITEATFDLYGAQGAGFAATSEFAPGLGGRATATITLTPGASIEVNVGGSGVVGGFNGGGTSAGIGSGGGASDIRVGGTAPADRVLVAGGGGGAGQTACGGQSVHGGAGGGATGGPGSAGAGGCGAPVGGGGTQIEGGSATAPATAGGFGTGGSAGAAGAGGGGGGWFGGGGGGVGAGVSGGGGGGSGHGPAGTTFETGVRSGNGLVTVSYELDPPPVTTIAAGPEGVTTDPSPSFGFASDQAGSSFECSFDGAAFDACTSPQGYSELADGPHTFAVRATNDQLTTGTAASREFTVDTTAAGLASAKKTQRQTDKVVVKLKLSATDEALKTKAKGSVKLGRKDFKLASQALDLDAGATETVKLRPRKDEERLLRGLADGKSAEAKPQVKFTDSAGNTAIKKLRVKLTD